MIQLADQVILITGASSGIGRAIALEAAKTRADVVLCARSVDKLHQVKTECEMLSKKPAYVYPLDISDPNQIDQVLEDVYRDLGKIDVLVNNAGFGVTEEFVSMKRETIQKLFEVNVLGLMYITQKVAIEMSKKQQGHIFHMGSMAGKVATAKTAVYSAAKSAVIGFSNALRIELKPFGIQVTTINPGPVETPFFESSDSAADYLEKVNFFVLSPEKVAKKVISSIGKQRREINLPFVLSKAADLYVLFPRIGDYLLTHYFQK